MAEKLSEDRTEPKVVPAKQRDAWVKDESLAWDKEAVEEANRKGAERLRNRSK